MQIASRKRLLSVMTILAAGFLPFRVAAQGSPERPRITGIDHVRIYVSDLAVSQQFYSKLLGFRAQADCSDKSVRCFSVGGEQDQHIELEYAPTPTPKNWLADISFATDDVKGLRAYVAAHNQHVSTLSNNNLGRRPVSASFKVNDPEGTPISFIQRFTHSVRAVGPLDASYVKILHAGFVVNDMAAENHFYRDLLGFRLYWQGGFKDNGLDWYEIQVPDGRNWIEYMLNIPANADHKELGIQNHFSLGVNDIKVTAAYLRSHGITNFDGPEIGRDGKWSLDAYDPDGTRIEFMEFAPAQKPCCHPYTAEHPKP